MNTSSDRHATQTYIEGLVGCNSAREFADKRNEVLALEVGYQAAAQLQLSLDIDAHALKRKAMATLIQGLSALDRRQETWGVIQLYYSTYFMMRMKLALDGVALLNCKGTMFSLTALPGSTPQRHTSKAYSNDHRAAASLFITNYKQSNELLSQTIEGEEAPRWLFDRRSWVNYQRREMIDDGGDWAIGPGVAGYAQQTRQYCEDELPIFCFMPEFASLAYPLQLALQTFSVNAYSEVSTYVSANATCETPSVVALLGVISERRFG